MGLDGVPNVSLTWLIWATKAASIGAYVVQWFELFDHLAEEIEYLWSAPMRFVTWLYVWSRYFPLCAQLVNLTLSYLTHTSPEPKLCIVTFTLKAITAQLMTTCVEVILVVRVHALYNCSYRIGLFLASIMLVGTSLEVAGTLMSVTELEPGPKGNICIPKRCPTRTLITFGIGCGLIQSVLLAMTLGKIALHRKTGWLRTPVVSLMLRDGVGIFLMLTVIVVSILAFEMVRNEGVLVWNVTFSWYISLLSIAGCRLILNIRKLAVDVKRPRHRGHNESVQFSSIFEDDQYFSTPDNATV